MKKLFRWLDLYLEEAALVVLLVVITIVMVFQIIMRFVFNNSMMWPEEFNRLCFIVSAFFTLGYAIRKKKMLKVDIVMKLLPKAFGTVVDYIGKIVALALYVYLFYGVWNATANAIKQVSKTPAIGMPWYVIYVLVTIAFGLAILRSVQELVMDTKARIQKGREVQL